MKKGRRALIALGIGVLVVFIYFVGMYIFMYKKLVS